ERFQTAAQFRDALGEWLFEHRHRMTPKPVADVVLELRDAVIERRNKTVNAGTTVLDDVSITRSPTDEGIPAVISEREPSMPLISVSYDQSHGSDPVAGARAISVGDLAAHVARPRADTINARPNRATAQPTPASGLPVKRPTPARPRPAHVLRDERDGVVEVPIADTISAAIEGITLP